jgi:acetyl-CoA synthetase
MAEENELVPVPERVQAGANVVGMHNYMATWERSVDKTDEFWGEQARARLDWITPFKTVARGTLEDGNVAWFPDGTLNVSVNCLDRHPADKLAIIWEGDEPTDIRRITYGEALGDTCRLANALRHLGAAKVCCVM